MCGAQLRASDLSESLFQFIRFVVVQQVTGSTRGSSSHGHAKIGTTTGWWRYTIAAGLNGRDWKDLREEEKQQLLAELNAELG